MLQGMPVTINAEYIEFKTSLGYENSKPSQKMNLEIILSRKIFSKILQKDVAMKYLVNQILLYEKINPPINACLGIIFICATTCYRLD